jgi:nitroimidazol reductase NimA-like FMN-containing flavoprotein (pyridoxamine 5'-phosphate oxidase superfamily)
MPIIRKKIITNREEIEKIIKKCKVIFVGMSVGDEPYVLPFNFGYKDGIFYIHGTPEGKKIDYLKANPQVCISLEIDSELFVRHETMACSYSMTYTSIVAYGKAEFIDDFDSKVEAFNIIMSQYTGRSFTYSKPSIDNVAVIRIPCHEITGHIRGV